MKTAKQIACVSLAIVIGLLSWYLLAIKPASAQQDSQNVPDVIRAKRFEVVDDEGNSRVVIHSDTQDNSLVSILDKNGQERARLWCDGQGTPSLALQSPSGKTPELVLAVPNGNPQLWFSDQKSKLRTALSCSNKTGSKLMFAGKNSDSLVLLALSDDDKPFLILGAKGGKGRKIEP